MSKSILVTGATGFVGRQVIRSLDKHDVQLRLVVREGKESQIEPISKLKEVISTKDLFTENVSWWAKQCEGMDTIIHLAWFAQPGLYLESPKNLDCLIGSLNLVKAAAKVGVRRFIGVGTCFEYDLSLGVLSVETPLKPLTPYADAKTALYLSASHWLPQHSVEFAWCRLFYLYGEGEDPRRLVPFLRDRLSKGEPAELSTGNQIRDFEDVASAGQLITKIALGKQQGPVNICSGVPVTVRQIAEKIADEYGRRDLLKFGARPENQIDPRCVLGIPNITDVEAEP